MMSVDALVLHRWFSFRLGRRSASEEAPGATGDPPSLRDGVAKLTARDLMTREPATVQEDTRMAGVAAVMLEHNTGCVLVTAVDGRPRGLITESDFVVKEGTLPFSWERQPQLFGEPVSLPRVDDAYSRGRWLTAGEVMSPIDVSVRPETSIVEVVRLMFRRHVEYVPVIANSRVAGIISRRDLLRLVARGEVGGSEDSDPRSGLIGDINDP
jgi:CBS domain-containing protein